MRLYGNYDVIIGDDESPRAVMNALVSGLGLEYVILNEVGPNGNGDLNVLVIGERKELEKFELRYNGGGDEQYSGENIQYDSHIVG